MNTSAPRAPRFSSTCAYLALYDLFIIHPFISSFLFQLRSREHLLVELIKNSIHSKLDLLHADKTCERALLKLLYRTFFTSLFHEARTRCLTRSNRRGNIRADLLEVPLAVPRSDPKDALHTCIQERSPACCGWSGLVWTGLGWFRLV